jgi:hypothetical protein
MARSDLTHLSPLTVRRAANPALFSKSLSGDESVAALKGELSVVQDLWRHTLNRMSAAGWQNSIARNSLLWGK